MMQDTMTRLRAFAKVQSLLTSMEFRRLATQGSMLLAALVMGLVALVMLNLAGFLGLAEKIGYAWSALVFAGIDLVLTAIVVTIAKGLKPGPEVESATQVRDLLLNEITADAEKLRTDFMQARADVQRIRTGIAAFAGGAKGIGPVVDLLTGALRKKKKKTE